MNHSGFSRYKRRFFLFSGFLLAMVGIRTFVFQIYMVSGNSMFPTFKNGDLVLVSKLGFPVSSEFFPWEFIYSTPRLERLDIVIFEDQENELNLKRVVGLPGEYYEIHHGRVMIDYRELEESYVPPGQETLEPTNEILYRFPDTPFLEMKKRGRIPPNYYMLLGDNREYSTDSRSFGLVPLHRLRGKVIGQYR